MKVRAISPERVERAEPGDLSRILAKAGTSAQAAGDEVSEG
jgi:hypothetical protein